MWLVILSVVLMVASAVVMAMRGVAASANGDVHGACLFGAVATLYVGWALHHLWLRVLTDRVAALEAAQAAREGK